MEEEPSDEEDESEAESVVSLDRQIQDDRTLTNLIGKQSYDYIDKIKEMYSNKQAKTKDDSDSEKEREQLLRETVFDERLQFINKMDGLKYPTVIESSMKPEIDLPVEYKNRTSKLRGLNQDKDAKLPIVFHEREIMENIESNIVTILCGETGSGKSTQIP